MKLTFDSSAKVCAEDADAPTTITFTGNAIIKGGTGIYASARESNAFEFTIAGNIVTK